jgi:hypothetical protein
MNGHGVRTHYSQPVTLRLFKATIRHLKNLTAISIDTINVAIADGMAKTDSDNKTVQAYPNDLRQ